jgi:S1-C subfamily serine protease
MRHAVLSIVAAFALGLVGCGDDETATRTSALAPAGGDGVADLVAKVLPGVVNVRTVGFDGSRGEGSGVVIDRQGIVVTNFHVIQGAGRVTVSFNDGRHKGAVRGNVVGTAAERDLAIIRLDLDDLVPVPLGRSSRLRLGDSVLAIGFPLNLGGPTVTQGIVSGLDRAVQPEGGPPLEGLLQTDAAINPGNSGGALVDATGRLVGINTAGATADAAENVGFAISIDEARPIIDEIRNKPAARRAWLGASFDVVDSSVAAAQLGLPPDVRGAVVIAVFAGGPAAQTGMKEGDVIVSIDGKAINSTEDVSKVLSELDPGDSVALEVVDRSGPRRITVKVGRRPATLPTR